MRCFKVLMAAGLCWTCSAARRSGWTKRADDEKEDGFANALSKKPSRQPAAKSKTPDLDSMSLLQALGADDGSLDQQEMLKVLSDALDTAIDTLSTPAKRRELYKPEVIKEITAQLPDMLLNMPEVQDMIKLLQSGDGEGTEKLREQIDAGLDMALEAAQQMRRVIQNPEELPNLVSEALDQLGLGDEEKATMLDMMSNPAAMQANMKLMMEQMQSEGMADELLQSEDFLKLMSDPAELTNKLAEMMQDPEIQAALQDPETAKVLQEMMADPDTLDAYAEVFGSKSNSRREQKPEQKRAAKKQRR